VSRRRLDLDVEGTDRTVRISGYALTIALASSALACAPDPPAAVVGIVVRTCAPGEGTGSGARVADGLVLTAAHVVAGAKEIIVSQGTRAVPATIVAFDPAMDLAYLAVGLPEGSTLAVDSSRVGAGDRGVAYVVRDGVTVEVPVRVVRRITIRTEDIYIEGETLRPGFEIRAAIEAGDSGGPIVVDGKLVGVVWARSRNTDDRAYAIDPVGAGALITRQLDSGELGPDIDVTRCY
jgi:S1-C subfamily serine protease